MGKDSKIEWTDHTFNPWWGCTKVSPACDNCYAETWANRCGFPNLWGSIGRSHRRTFGGKHWAEPLKWDRAAAQSGKRTFVFCGSMCDVFEDHPMLMEPRDRLFRLIDDTPNLTWLLLTKRPGNIRKLTTGPTHRPNVWHGATVESDAYAWRCSELEQVDTVCRFLSVEPMLGPVNLIKTQMSPHWIICGGESGPGSRAISPEHVRTLRDDCAQLGIPFFFKQWGDWAPCDQITDPKATQIATGMQRVGKKAAGALLDGREWKEIPQ